MGPFQSSVPSRRSVILITAGCLGEQLPAARRAFTALVERRFLPFDQIDEDAARAELDRRLLVDVMGLPRTLCEPDGPLELLRRKLAREPQVHGGKKTRVVFRRARGGNGGEVISEGTAKRSDR